MGVRHREPPPSVVLRREVHNALYCRLGLKSSGPVLATLLGALMAICRREPHLLGVACDLEGGWSHTEGGQKWDLPLQNTR